MLNRLMNKLVDYIAGSGNHNFSEEVLRLSKLAIIDTVGVAIAGGDEPVVQKNAAAFSDRISGRELATVWHSGEKIQLEYAAMVNGTAAHALDYDDVAPSILAHPSAPLTASILPLAEVLNKSGKDVITAYAIGAEVMTEVGKVMGFEHYNLGWHATSTLGTIGSTAACAYLAGLPKEKVANAIAISASMSSGLQKNFGTMTKPLHVGLAAQYAVQAIMLAREGMEGNTEIFNRNGFFQAFTGGRHDSEMEEIIRSIEFGKVHDYEENGLSFKKFACCYFMHRFTAGVLEIQKETSLTLDELEEIQLTVPPGGLTALIHSRPVTGLQGKFSAEYASVAALLDGTIQLKSFTDEQVMRPSIQENLALVKKKEAEGSIKDASELEKIPVHVKLISRSGEEFDKEILHAPGSKEQPMTILEHKEKWIDCLNYSAGSALEGHHLEAAHQLFNEGIQMEQLIDIHKWLEGIRGVGAKSDKSVTV